MYDSSSVRVSKPWQPTRRFWVGLGLGLLLVVAAVFVVRHWSQIYAATEEFIAKQIGAKVEQVLVTGVTYTNPAELREALGIKKGDTLVGFKAAEARARIEAIDWVRVAAVERKLPSTIKIQIYEYIPLALVEMNDGEWVIDREGRLIARKDNRLNNLPILRGEGASEQAAPLFSMLGEQPILMNSLKSADYIGTRRWDVTFANNVRVMLPEENPVQALKILIELNNRRNVLSIEGATVDLRLSDRIILRLPENSPLQLL